MPSDTSPRAPLGDAPWDAVDRHTGLPRHGSYRGSVRSVELSRLAPDRLERLSRHKRWVWACVTTKDLLVSFAVVDLGYATSTFGYAWSPDEGMLVDVAQLGLPGLASVRRDGIDRVRARFRSAPFFPRADVTVREPVSSQRIEVDVNLPNLKVTGVALFETSPAAMTAIASVPRGIVNVTEKRVLAPFVGALLLNGRRIELDEASDAVFGWDVTEGLLARATRWKWAFAQGRTDRGEAFALNLVEGFVGEPECTLWLAGKVIPVGEGRFVHDLRDPLQPWSVRTTCGSVELSVTPTAMHSDEQDLSVIRSKFFQAVGRGSGTLRHAGQESRFEAVPIVVEDQDMKW